MRYWAKDAPLLGQRQVHAATDLHLQSALATPCAVSDVAMAEQVALAGVVLSADGGALPLLARGGERARPLLPTRSRTSSASLDRVRHSRASSLMHPVEADQSPARPERLEPADRVWQGCK